MSSFPRDFLSIGLMFGVICCSGALGGALAFAEPAVGQATGAARPGPSDAEIAKIVVTANDGEIQQGKWAIEHSKSKEVKDFAKQMVKAHETVNKNAAQVAQRAKLVPKQSQTSDSLKLESESALADLKEKQGADFDRGYVDAQVKAHQDVLNAIDTTLLPNAKNPDLRAMLEKTRPQVASHLEHAQMLQKSLQKSLDASARSG
jgi:putative membrane protein